MTNRRYCRRSRFCRPVFYRWHLQSRPGNQRFASSVEANLCIEGAQDAQALLRCLLETSPDRWGYLAVNWTVPLLVEQIGQATGYQLSEDTIRRALHKDDYVWKRPRYVLEPDPEREKKASDTSNRAWIGSRNRPCGPAGSKKANRPKSG